ncbi:MAG: hypothetical protein WEB53_08885 [Akkermansiaceae bacterium]
MKSFIRKLTLCALLGASTGVHAVEILIPNGNFDAGSTGWLRVDGSGQGPAVTFAAGGNPGGYGSVTPNGGWGILVSPTVAGNAGGGVPLADLGLTAGTTVTFTYDSKNITGPGPVGGFKWEAWGGNAIKGDTGERFPTLIGNGTTWETYTYTWTIPAGTEKLIFVPLWAGGANTSTVGFDNVGVDNTPVTPPPFVPDQIPNGDFEIALGVDWNEFTVGPAISYPSSGGNPGGHAVIDATTTDNFAAIQAFDGAEKTFASLGLVPGDTFTVQWDMQILEGTTTGGIQLVGGAGYTAPPPGEERPLRIGSGSTWETYTKTFTVPASPAQARFEFVWGFNSKVAFDNIFIVQPAPSGPLQATIAQVTSVSWTAGSQTNLYQPQQSTDNSNWTNLGSAFVGNAVSALFDITPSPFYRVLESVPAVSETIYNGDFSVEGLFAEDADGWIAVQSQLAFRLATGGRTGVDDPCMQLKVLNSDAAPNGSEVQQNTKDADFLNPGAGAVIPGNSYNFSLWVKQISSGITYEQRFKISFLDDTGAIKGDGGFVNFLRPVTGNWVEVTQNGLIAPAGATTALIQILGVTGAVAGGLGEVLIDDVSLKSAGFGTPTVLAATATPAVEISWPSTTGQSYQVQSAPNLVDWTNFGGVISGNNTTKSVYDTISIPAKFYKVGELP